MCYNTCSMSTNLTSIDISTLKPSDLLRIVEEVATTKTPRELKRDSKTVAILMPPEVKATSRKTNAKTKADYEAFRSAAGGWKDVDTDRLLKDIYVDRRRTNARPPVKL